jgi:ABC-type histidine transport system ATPase subunit
MYKLEVQDLHKRYGSHEVLKGVSLAASTCWNSLMAARFCSTTKS